MKTLARAGLVLVGAVGFAVALSLTASADVVEETAPVDPATAVLDGIAPLMQGGMTPLDEGFWATLDVSDEVVATPAPELVVRPAPARVVRNAEAGSVLDRTVSGFRVFGTFLGQVADACRVGLASGAGGPVLMVAVLGMAIALNRRRVLGARLAADEEAPELLFAWAGLPPG